MRRATTPTHEFRFIVDPAKITDLLITYSQDGKIIMEKEKDDLTFDGKVGTYTLTQEETKLFHNGTIKVQLRAKFENNRVAASQVSHIKVKDVLNDKEL